MSKIEVTLAQLRQHRACFDGYNKVVASIMGGGVLSAEKPTNRYRLCSYEGPIPLENILDSNGIQDAIWALRCVPGIERDVCLFAVWCARQVQHLMIDRRSIDALDAAERFANRHATITELKSAAAAAACAADAACAAYAACAADAAYAAAYAAADYAAACAADAAADYAACAADAAYAAAYAAAADYAACAADAACAAYADARSKQCVLFRGMCNGNAPWQKKED